MSQYKATALSLITVITDKSRDVRVAGHAALCNATMHAVAHGDVTLCDRILDALGKAHDRKLVVDWLKEYGCAKWNKTTASFELSKSRRKALAASNITLQELMDNPAWHEAGKSKEQIVREYDLIAKIKAVVTGYDNAKEEGKPTKNDWAAGAIASLLTQLQASAATEGSV